MENIKIKVVDGKIYMEIDPEKRASPSKAGKVHMANSGGWTNVLLPDGNPLSFNLCIKAPS